MDHSKKQQSKLTGITSIKKTVFTTFTAYVLIFGVGSAAFAGDNDLTTVYDVYIKDKYIGTVSDKNMVNELIQDKLKEMKKSYHGCSFSVSKDFELVPEQVFRIHMQTNNRKVLDELKKELEVQANASALVIDGKAVAYVKNKTAAEAVLKKLKLNYVSEKQLAEVEARKKEGNRALPPLKENETRIIDVKLSNNVSITDTKTAPQQILTADEAVKLLLKGTLEEKKYQAKEGDVLGSIAENHGLTIEQLLRLNPGLKEDSFINIGDELNVTVYDPYVFVVVDKEVFKKETISYKNKIVEDSSMFKGDTKIKQEGKNGSRAVAYVISEQNGKTVKKTAIKEEILQEPVDHIVVKGTKVIPSRGEGSFAWPAVGGYVSSKMGYRWGKMHKGIDIARPSDRTIKAADNGVVVSAGWDGGYGKKIVIDHQNGFRTVYAHLSSINASVGQTVSKGTKIGVMGSTGDSTGVHLHFEVSKNGRLQNPLNYLP
ncbi:metalloprotease yebA [Bacillus methanolicus PB1]|uniref:Metalloprotease yebA n=1 Tax=Bacillus methanolicus PB1 TaxID=997296 RepID=I3E106_BACMT|nr:M23 family metallopeptidase [Bacillus methanolicus]EIJ80177.1 metalloprotease yebA [Bacillus methanolicus PB1]